MNSFPWQPQLCWRVGYILVQGRSVDIKPGISIDLLSLRPSFRALQLLAATSTTKKRTSFLQGRAFRESPSAVSQLMVLNSKGTCFTPLIGCNGWGWSPSSCQPSIQNGSPSNLLWPGVNLTHSFWHKWNKHPQYTFLSTHLTNTCFSWSHKQRRCSRESALSVLGKPRPFDILDINVRIDPRVVP